MKNYSALCNAPPPFPKESICSWLSRLSLSQGVSLWAMLSYLELKLFTDFDFQFGNLNINSISRKTGLILPSFKNQQTFYKSLNKYDSMANTYVMRYERKRKYRYCPLCLQEDETPYFRMEWRLKLCVSCPIHSCLLEEDCPRCRNPIILPVNLFTKVSDERPLESLANCPTCGTLLIKIYPAFFKGGLYNAMDEKTKGFIESGELLVAAFYEGNIRRNKEVQELKPLFSKHARKRKVQFKWTARTWRLKVKRYLKANPMASGIEMINSDITYSSKYQANLSRRL